MVPLTLPTPLQLQSLNLPLLRPTPILGKSTHHNKKDEDEIEEAENQEEEDSETSVSTIAQRQIQALQQKIKKMDRDQMELINVVVTQKHQMEELLETQREINFGAIKKSHPLAQNTTSICHNYVHKYFRSLLKVDHGVL